MKASVLKRIIARLTRLSFPRGSADADSQLPRFPSMEASFIVLRDQGFSPETCIDIGAYEGSFAQMVAGLFPRTRILMIEAQERKRGVLESAIEGLPDGSAVAIALLGAEDGRRVAFTEMETGSSVFEERSNVPRRRHARITQRLDSLLVDNVGFAAPQFLKLDTQGYELEILKGALGALKSVDVLLLEVSLVQVNDGCPLFAEVIKFLHEQHFMLFDICSMIRRVDGVLWQVDMLFISERSAFVPEKRLTLENWGAAKDRYAADLSLPPSLRR